MSDFRVPINIFKQYSVVMKGLNQECQNIFLTAMGVDLLQHESTIDWESFIKINYLLKYSEKASAEEYYDFMVKAFDPHRTPSGLIRKDVFEETLHALFKGQFNYR